MANVRIEVRANGPNRITGPIEIVDQDGNAYAIPEGKWVAFCRCGRVEQQALLRWNASDMRLRVGIQGKIKSSVRPDISGGICCPHPEASLLKMERGVEGQFNYGVRRGCGWAKSRGGSF